MRKATENTPPQEPTIDEIGASLLKAAISGERSEEYLLQARHQLLRLGDAAADEPAPAWIDSVRALIKADHSDFSAQDFTSAPEVSPLRDLKSFSVYGLDFKVDPFDQVKLIEANGINSGMSGFAKTHSDSLDEANQPYRADRALENHLHQYGEKHLAMIGTLLCQFGMARFRLPIVKDLAQELIKATLRVPLDHKVCQPAPEWIADCFRFAVHLRTLEGFLASKTLTDGLLEPLREYKPKSYPLTQEGIASFHRNEENVRFAVLKPDTGAQGKGVTIIPSNELERQRITLYEARVIEPFVESTPIYCKETRNVHDGCMRLVVIAERKQDDSLHFRHFGGYWRLCPRPIDEYGNLEAMRANLCQKAIPQVAAEAHVAMVQPAAEKIITLLEDRLHRAVPKVSAPTLSDRV